MKTWDWVLAGCCVAWLLGLIWIGHPENDLLKALWSQNMAAWVQALGSIGAIGVAIWVSHRDSLKARAAEKRRHQDDVLAWESALLHSVKLVSNVDRMMGANGNATWDEKVVDRLIQTASKVLDLYLELPPPSTALAFSLTTARGHIRQARNAIAALIEMHPRARAYAAQEIKERLKAARAVRESRTALDELVNQYEAGLL
ncbi:hypothetical protein GCM10017620_24870 [Brevundimonas intermedia]|uniref:DUF4239 domain-containing protein n=1 Tax=Brevundimonas intermedia TaxID=74315 RepID=A0ABQ5TBS0_9CAUL|nr:hypothetical protein [Brevundimonas intermedia]GLK49514.1 hypothetical protein GCM10017620_24870 [Brevundimonas intermedia]